MKMIKKALGYGGLSENEIVEVKNNASKLYKRVFKFGLDYISELDIKDFAEILSFVKKDYDTIDNFDDDDFESFKTDIEDYAKQTNVSIYADEDDFDTLSDLVEFVDDNFSFDEIVFFIKEKGLMNELLKKKKIN